MKTTTTSATVAHPPHTEDPSVPRSSVRPRNSSQRLLSNLSPEEALHHTKRAILDAAERLFAEQGFRAASLRTLTTEAGVNLGAVNYHFATKEALILAVLRRRIRPLNEARLAMLSAFEAEAGSNPVTLEKVLEALFRPVLEFVVHKGKAGTYLVQLIAQCLAEPGVRLQPVVQEEFSERDRRFHSAIAHALPGLSHDEVHWRLHFVHGVFLHTLANARLLEVASKGRCRLANVDSVLGKIISFCAAGLKAAPSTGDTSYGSTGSARK